MKVYVITKNSTVYGVTASKVTANRIRRKAEEGLALQGATDGRVFITESKLVVH